ncbi:MAG: Phosphoenolpyruvate carboxylase [Candidatus Heimdallarchaeota archaeon LC_3]|nr:MAG: Phosphoenolpyruvate carboxylase [Candidatus Heimdallarchaeota archaeon LC_3]
MNYPVTSCEKVKRKDKLYKKRLNYSWIRTRMSEDIFKEILYILGDTLGEVIIEQSGRELFEKVEKIRLLSKNLRDKYKAENFSELYNELDQYIKNLAITDVLEISRSFTVYLMLNNIAELVFRTINKEESYKSELRTTIKGLIKEKGRKSDLQEYLQNFRYRIVLTQHPTEVKRRTILLKEKNIYKSLLMYFNKKITKESLINRLKEIIESLWLTAEVRLKKPTVNDEIEAAGAYANYSLFEVIPDIVNEFWEELKILDSNPNYSFVPLIDVGTWVGGDRDGNPFVTINETKYALNYNRNLTINHYLSELDKIYEIVSISNRRVSKIFPSFKNKLDSLLDTIDILPDRIKKLTDEPYRQWIGICKHKLQHSLILQENDFEQGFKTYIEFKEMIQNLIDALNFINAQNIIKGYLTKFIRKIDIFGFNFAKLDIRQHSEIFENLINEIYDLTNQHNTYKELKKSEKINLIQKSLNSPRIAIFVKDLSKESKELWGLFEFLLYWCEIFEPQALGSIVISMTQDETDVLEVLLLQYWIGLYEPNKKRHPIPIVPLFETISSLKDSIQIMDYLWANKNYFIFLEQLNLYQEIMIGYSDSAKDGGFLSSQWNIYQTQEKLLKLVGEKYSNIKLFFFHGRGGSVGRGGGPPKSAILGLPPKANFCGMKVTEQGEVISQKYLHKEIAREMLTENFLAIHNSNIAYREVKTLSQNDRDLIDSLTTTSENKFRILTEKEEFIKFFEEASPIEFISNLNIGSRPAKRKETKKITDLRAIPWIFAWTQNRLLLPVWYGVGTALEELYKNQDHYDQLCELLEKWPFFVSLMDNLSTQLLKVDMNSARKYANLSSEKQLFFEMFKEYFRTRRNVRKISHDPHIKTQNPFLRKAIEARIPYLDPLTLIQVNAIEQYRKNHENEFLEIILLTVNGIALGMKNTG